MCVCGLREPVSQNARSARLRPGTELTCPVSALSAQPDASNSAVSLCKRSSCVGNSSSWSCPILPCGADGQSPRTRNRAARPERTPHSTLVSPCHQLQLVMFILALFFCPSCLVASFFLHARSGLGGSGFASPLWLRLHSVRPPGLSTLYDFSMVCPQR